MTKFIAKASVALIATWFLCLPHNANAIDANEGAKKFVEQLSNGALTVITSADNESDKEAKLTQLFVDSVDTKWIAHFAMGKYWKTATEQQKSEYVAIHRKFLINSYIPKFKQFNNQEIKILKSYSDEKNLNEYVVETQIIPKDSSAIKVDYKIRNNGNSKYVIYDVVAEGVSLINTERSDFGSVLSRGGIDHLISMLQKKV